jgi:hypothetical protein
MRHRELVSTRLNIIKDPVTKDLESEYSVGKSQNAPLNVYAFLQLNAGDPATDVCWHPRFPSIINDRSLPPRVFL